VPLLPQHEVDLDRLRELGARSTAAFLPEQPWLFRRVESISFIGSAVLRRKVSVDYWIPRGLPSTRRTSGLLFYVPLSVLSKWPPLLSFDLRTDHQPGHLLTAEGNGEMDAALLKALIRDHFGPERALGCEGAAHKLATLRTSDAWQAYSEISSFLEDAEPEDARQHVLRIAHSMARARILWVPVVGHAGDRHVAHFSYDVRFGTAQAAFRIRAARTLSWGGGDEYLEVPHVGQSGSYHIDVQAPEGLQVIDTSLYFLYDRPQHGEELPPSPIVNTQEIGERAHVYTTSHRPGSALLRVRMMPGWRGFIGAAWMMALGIAGLLTAFWRWSSAMTMDPTSSVALLVIVPAVLGVITLRPRTHPRTFDRLVGVQLLLFLSGSLSIFSALVAIRFEKRLEPTRALWRDAAYGSYLVFILISFSLLIAVIGERKLRKSEE
jgi:hypothetical protein